MPKLNYVGASVLFCPKEDTWSQYEAARGASLTEQYLYKGIEALAHHAAQFGCVAIVEMVDDRLFVRLKSRASIGSSGGCNQSEHDV